jgi:nucleoside-diphosphate-sugar epimerase
VGGHLAEALQAKRVVYGHCRNGDVHVSQAEGLLRKADVIINAGGFRVRRGLTLADYRRSHEGATSAIVPWIHKGALLLHISSAHVLGKSKHIRLGNRTPPNPTTYPSSEYALAKLEADRFVERAAVKLGFRVILLRPTILYARPGDTSLPDNLCQLAKRGIILRLYPRDARHHLCHSDILVEVVRRILERDELPNLSSFVVADPYTVTSRELERMIVQYLGRRSRIVPVPTPWMSTVLRNTFHSKNPKFDLRTWGDIFGVFHLDTVYDPFETFRTLGIDSSAYSLEKGLEPLIRQALQD